MRFCEQPASSDITSPWSRAELPLACSAEAPSRLKHALSSAQHLSLLHCDAGVHFAAGVIANSLEGALLRVSLEPRKSPLGPPTRAIVSEANF